MPLAEAVALTGPAADGKHKEPRMCTADRTIHQAPLDPQADRRAMEELAEWCRQFSPIVAIEVASAPESLFLEITGLSHLFGGERSLAEQVLRALGSRGLSARVAAADTFGAAWATAHFMECSPPCIIPPGQSLPWLRDLPIEALRLPDDVIDLLHPLGIYSIGQLEQLPRADLAARFGSCLTERWDQAVGRQAEPIPAQQSPPELEAKQSLEYATTQREAVEFILDQLIRRVAEMLSRCGRGAARLDCRLDCRPAGCVDLSVGLFQATASARHLAELARLRLERISLPGPVQAISVAASATALLEHRQEELFADGPPRQRLRLWPRWWIALPVAWGAGRSSARAWCPTPSRNRPTATICCWKSGPSERRERREGAIQKGKERARRRSCCPGRCGFCRSPSRWRPWRLYTTHGKKWPMFVVSALAGIPAKNRLKAGLRTVWKGIVRFSNENWDSPRGFSRGFVRGAGNTALRTPGARNGSRPAGGAAR